MREELEVERHNLETQLHSVGDADNSYSDTISIIFELASKAHQLFKSSEVEEKRKIITLLLPRVEVMSNEPYFLNSL